MLETFGYKGRFWYSEKHLLLDKINNDESLKSRLDVLLQKDWYIYNKIINGRNE